MNKVAAIIVAAGEGRRFGEAKQFAELRGKSVLDRSLECFDTHEAIDQIILVLRKDVSGEDYLQKFGKIIAIAEGGERRQDSVQAGFNKLSASDSNLNCDTEIVLVHDAARPLVSKDLINRIIKAAREYGAAVPLISIEDTVKEINERFILRTVDRQKLFRAQTPQGFLFSVLKDALIMASKKQVQGTDESFLVEQINKPVLGIPGEKRNIKITSPGDLRIAEVLLED